MRRSLPLFLAAIVFGILAASPAAAQSCEQCTYLTCDTPCWYCAGAEHPDGSCGRIEWTACGGETNDYDGDGVGNATDNCICTANSSQANCDGDGFGDACDSQSSSYVLQSEQTCWIDRDTHFGYFDLDKYVDRYYVDTSSCNAPSYYDTYIADSARCYNVTFIDTYQCCREVLGESEYWCNRVGQNDCQGN